MFELHCEDLIQNLYRKTGVLRELILKKMSQDHQVSGTLYIIVGVKQSHLVTHPSGREQEAVRRV